MSSTPRDLCGYDVLLNSGDLVLAQAGQAAWSTLSLSQLCPSGQRKAGDLPDTC